MTARAPIEPRLTAAEAAQLIAPGGGVSERTVADAMRSGALLSERIGRVRFTTAPWIREWLRSCRSDQKDRASISAVERAEKASTLSATDEKKLALAAAQATAEALRRRSGNTSSARGERPQQRSQPVS